MLIIPDRVPHKINDKNWSAEVTQMSQIHLKSPLAFTSRPGVLSKERALASQKRVLWLTALTAMAERSTENLRMLLLSTRWSNLNLGSFLIKLNQLIFFRN